MRKFHELFYKIGRIVNYVMLGVHALFVVIYSIILIVDAVAGRSVAGDIGSIVTNVIFAGIAVAMIFLDRKFSEDALKAPADNLTPVIILLVGGVFVALDIMREDLASGRIVARNNAEYGRLRVPAGKGLDAIGLISQARDLVALTILLFNK